MSESGGGAFYDSLCCRPSFCREGGPGPFSRKHETTDPRRGRGIAGEDIAASRLERAGYTIIDRNYRTRFGELDIIARKGEVVAFIEVKARSDKSLGEPFEAVTRGKQKRIRRMAEAWLMVNAMDEIYRDCAFRFDVISILLDSDGSAAGYEHIVDAFR